VLLSLAALWIEQPSKYRCSQSEEGGESMNAKSAITKPVPPDAVRIWRGFKNKALSQGKFFADLGSVFVPATVQLQWPSGLDAYIPSFPAGKGKPATVPDETAILFWDSQNAYKSGFNTLAIRTYTMTHASVYNVQDNISTADFPVLYAGKIVAKQCYYFFPDEVDWMGGAVFHLVGGRPGGTTPAKFLASIQDWATAYQKKRPAGVSGAILCATADYVVFWSCLDRDNSGAGMAALAKLCKVYHHKVAQPVSLPAGMFDNFLGLIVKPGDSFNMQFSRRPISC
jgi:hypothetical protein